MHNCRACKHIRKETEGWELPHIWWWECLAKPAMPNLKSFPFRNTKCKSFEASSRDQHVMDGPKKWDGSLKLFGQESNT